MKRFVAIILSLIVLIPNSTFSAFAKNDSKFSIINPNIEEMISSRNSNNKCNKKILAELTDERDEF